MNPVRVALEKTVHILDPKERKDKVREIVGELALDPSKFYSEIDRYFENDLLHYFKHQHDYKLLNELNSTLQNMSKGTTNTSAIEMLDQVLKSTTNTSSYEKSKDYMKPQV